MGDIITSKYTMPEGYRARDKQSEPEKINLVNQSQMQIIPDDSGKTLRLLPEVANSFELLRNKMREMGYEINPSDTWRSSQAQAAAYAKKGYPAQEKKLKESGEWDKGVMPSGTATEPGKSEHELGRAFDFNMRPIITNSDGSTSLGPATRDFKYGSPLYKQFTDIASQYGIVHPTWAKPGGGNPEVWHWEYPLAPDTGNPYSKEFKGDRNIPMQGVGQYFTGAETAKSALDNRITPTPVANYIPQPITYSAPPEMLQKINYNNTGNPVYDDISAQKARWDDIEQQNYKQRTNESQTPVVLPLFAERRKNLQEILTAKPQVINYDPILVETR